MAVCEIWDVSGKLEHPIDYAKNPEKTKNPKYSHGDLQAMRDVMTYAMNFNKTVGLDNKSEMEYFISAVNCDVSTAREEMIMAKKQWSDESEIVCYHGFQSFKEGEVTPEQAHEVGVKLAERMWGERFQVIVATHLNTRCCHNHFVINSVSFVDGKHYHDNKKNLALLRKMSDELCRSYELSVIENPKGRKKPYTLYMAEKAGLPTREVITRAAVDDAIKAAFTLKDFEKNMRQAGYIVNLSGGRKYWTIKGAGWDRAKRLYRLGEDYTNERIMERILENSYAVAFSKFSPESEKQYRKVIGIRKPKRKVGGLRGLYLHYCFRLGILPKRRSPNVRNVHSLLRDDLMKLDHITKETRLLCSRQMDTAEDVLSYKQQLTTEKTQLISNRRKLYAKSEKAGEAEKEEIRSELSKIALRLKEIRREVRLCDGIMERSSYMSEKLLVIREEEKRKEGKKDVRRRRCGRADGENEPARS